MQQMLNDRVLDLVVEVEEEMTLETYHHPVVSALMKLAGDKVHTLISCKKISLT